VKRHAKYLGVCFGRLFGKMGHCYRHLEKRLNEEEELCQVGFLWLMAYVAMGQGWLPEDSFCKLVYAVCKDAGGRPIPGCACQRIFHACWGRSSSKCWRQTRRMQKLR